jgi:hypothetical protein
MNRKNDYPYDDDKLTGLDIADLIVTKWQTGAYHSIADVTTAVHSLKTELPRSVVFWLAYHTLREQFPAPLEPQPAAPWPLR